MNSFYEIINYVRENEEFTSNLGKAYTLKQLSPIKFGTNWVIMPSTTGMTKSEREGWWTLG